MAKRKPRALKTMGPPPDPASFLEIFESVQDPRVVGRCAHSLESILLLVLCAVISRANEITEIEYYGLAREKQLSKLVSFPNGIPSHDTIGRVLGLLDPDQLERAFTRWMNRAAELTDSEVVAIDGKTLRRARDKAGVGFVHMVSAWAVRNGVVLGQVKTDDKSNEITAIPRLLELLQIKGCIVTIDAMGCQTAIAEQIVEAGADYILAVKDNQPKLLEAVSETFDEKLSGRRRPADVSFTETKNKGHGRREVRRCWTIAVPEDSALRERWRGLETFIMVEAERTLGDTTSLATRWFISSRSALDATTALGAIRDHWGIENKLHWVLDVAFREDESRVRAENAAENFVVFRHIALNLLRNMKSSRRGVKGRRNTAAWSEDFFLQVLTGGVDLVR
jgi:predicted transposase YbfD/YdcC